MKQCSINPAMNLDMESGAQAHALSRNAGLRAFERGLQSRHAFGVRRFTGALGSGSVSGSSWNGSLSSILCLAALAGAAPVQGMPDANTPPPPAPHAHHQIQWVERCDGVQGESGPVRQVLELAQAAVPGNLAGVGVMAAPQPPGAPELPVPPQPPVFIGVPDVSELVGNAMTMAAGGGYAGGGAGFGIGGSWAAGVFPPLIVASDLNPGEQAELQEDLNVMHRILTKAVDKASGTVKGRTALGIELQLPLRQAGPSSLCIEDFGVVFFLQVNYPLVAPETQETSEPVAEKPADTTWEDARAELYGSNRSHARSAAAVYRLRNSGQVEPYDAGRVDALKAALLEMAKNASNIRHVEPEKQIVVVAQGPGQTDSSNAPSPKRERYGTPDPSATNRGARPTLMTLRFKKADADAAARGEISFEEFGRRVVLWTR